MTTAEDKLGVTAAEDTAVLPAVFEVALPDAPRPDDPPVTTDSSGSPAARVLVSCPECGSSAMVQPNRREAADFCVKCDYPLFWVQTDVVVTDPYGSSDESTRRLPGALGRVLVASVPCPHCAEPNLPTATVCIRCGLGMTLLPPPVPVAPPPAPVAVLEPAPVVYDEPNRWWLWVLAIVTVLLVAGVVVLAIRPWQ
jgi:hypothetical protein